MGRIDKERSENNNYSKEAALIRKTLKNSYSGLLDFLVEKLTSAGINVNQASLDVEVARYMKRLERELTAVAGHTLEKAYKDGQVKQLQDLYASMTLKEAKQFISGTNPTNMNTGSPNPNYADITEDIVSKVAAERVKNSGLDADTAASLLTAKAVEDKQFTALVADTYADILMATNNTRPAIKKVVREIVRDMAQLETLKGQAYAVQAKQIRKKLTKRGLSERIVKDGFVGIVDKAGRRWDLGTYTEMVVKTKAQQSYTQGVVYESEETGLDLAVISDHGAEDACSKWEGVVISLKGKTPGYPTLKEAKASKEIFHPNCEHSVHAIRRLDLLHPDDVARHKRKVKKVGKKEK